MNINAQTHAILLLTTHLGKQTEVKPLTTSEWGRFAAWLRSQQFQPEQLLSHQLPQLLSEWSDPTISLERIQRLLDRAAVLGFALEKWQRAGIWVIIRSDQRYPQQLKQRLKQLAPPVLFGCGNGELLNAGGIAVVGARHSTTAELAWTAELGTTLANHGAIVVSGGARGVDQTVMQAALAANGQAVGILADSLFKTALAASNRQALQQQQLVLVSPFNPEAGFDVGNAMGRNKYIYCLADAAIVVNSTLNKGGTWHGAIENLKAEWVPLWVKPNSAASSGNSALLNQGAQTLAEPITDLHQLINQPARIEATPLSLFDLVPAESNPEAVGAKPTSIEQPITINFYQLFLDYLKQTAKNPLSIEQIMENLQLTKPQVSEWLKRAIEAGYVVKINKPVRYHWCDNTKI
ncbi:DNA-processing protein DprA [Herpetosiphon llansteffanensis]|uniref:DNA-processing protein DprA n=1 Tax=Herpetosiphon llansteffanensis TaxID=2094568 RepID=UPI000D7BDB2F|nr:DNA-processing protein DprA [Herpetosiphon llansteffanensis]